MNRTLASSGLLALAVAFLAVAPAAFLAVAPAAAQNAEPTAEAEAEGGGPDAADEPEPAASPPPAQDSEIEEIVVLGAESEAVSDFEAADSVTGFGAEDLAALGAKDIADIAEFTPNLEIVTSGATTPTFFIRGVGLNDFNANSTGAVAIYQDDVPINAPALQLGSLFDVEAVNVLRGPQGTGLARNASAGAIKIYSRKPTGEFGGFLRSELGNFNFRDFEGAIEAPIYDDLVAGRFAFRFSERDGTMKNRCGDAASFEERLEDPVPRKGELRREGLKNTDAPWSQCGEPVLRINEISDVPVGLPTRINDIGNWAARGTVLFQPTLDMNFLLNAHGSKRDEWTRLGQSHGTNGFYCTDPDDFTSCGILGAAPSQVDGLLGGTQATSGYQAPEVRERWEELAPCLEGVPGSPDGTCQQTPEGRAERNAAWIKTANELAQGLDSKPWEGDFNFCGIGADADPDTPSPIIECPADAGRTSNDTWGGYLKGDIVLPAGIQLTTVTGYDTYDRFISTDLDFSPETLFHIKTEDSGWQIAQDIRFQGLLGDEVPGRWDAGGWFLREQLQVNVQNDLGLVGGTAGVGERDYTQDLWSAGGFVSLAFDFWERFTLDGGFRYNWERKTLDYALFQVGDEFEVDLDTGWHAPTGTIRLTYRFREDTHVFAKYTRGWKPGTYNATSALLDDFLGGGQRANVSIAEPETIDSFEAGVRGSWWEGRIGLDLSMFYYNYQNYQIFTAQQFVGGLPEFVILNADAAEVYGAEIDAVIRPWMGAFFNARFGWLESQFLDFVQLQQEGQTVNTPDGIAVIVVNRELQNTGNRLLNSPRFKLSLTAEQMLPLGRWGSITGRYDGVWTDVTYYDATEGLGIPNDDGVQFLPSETIAQPAFWLHNLRLSYRVPGGQIELAGWVRNMTNKAYKTFAFDGSTFNKTSIYFVGDPRTYGGTLMVNF